MLIAWAIQSVPPVTFSLSQIHVYPHPRRTSRKFVGAIGRVGKGATEQTFIIPDILSSTVAISLRIVLDRLVRMCVYLPLWTCLYTSTWFPFCLYSLPLLLTNCHSHSLCPSVLCEPRLVSAVPCDTTCVIAWHHSSILGAITSSHGNFIVDQHLSGCRFCK